MILVHALLVGCTFCKFYSLDKKMNFKFVFRWGFPDGANGKGPPTNAGDVRDMGLVPWVRKIPWRGARQPTAVFLPGKFHGQRSLAG